MNFINLGSLSKSNGKEYLIITLSVFICQQWPYTVN